ncbi:hypothetical protein QR97_08675 [Streptomyces sp. PBH53]|uniref:hypothetical protein n=1 Tax=Streptomyces TaxID=1883 RepID=UPI0006557C70|nr:hypothetical protein [Streptomyces sp. PBH53]AKN69893.1 hypothetical protein QR97_08675 [Streptomyces sp. PBH53]
MYTMEQAEQLATEFLRRLSADWDHEVALYPDEECKAQKGEFFYFAFQSTKFIATRDSKYFLYGPCQFAVHRETGECRLLSIQESYAINPSNGR